MDEPEMMATNGAFLMLCVRCETDDEEPTRQAIGIFRGFSLCRKHLDSWHQHGIFDISSPD